MSLKQEDKKMENAKRSFLELYALAVCFINVLTGSIAVGVIIYSMVSVIAPNLTLSGWEYARYQSNDNFIASRSDTKDLVSKFKNMSEQEVTRKREEAYLIVLNVERRESLQNIIRFVIIVLIQIILFHIHWKLAKKKRSSG